MVEGWSREWKEFGTKSLAVSLKSILSTLNPTFWILDSTYFRSRSLAAQQFVVESAFLRFIEASSNGEYRNLRSGTVVHPDLCLENFFSCHLSLVRQSSR